MGIEDGEEYAMRALIGEKSLKRLKPIDVYKRQVFVHLPHIEVICII